ncbi:MAG: hypothetical protein OES69_07725 [Myxococcales bacterium]|nr:hypothetical protein [Myxococcales bacterium]MDH3843812.1 hypothetical protein [Myxococcales bacterium]
MVQIAGCGERWNRVGVVKPTEWRAATDAVILASRLIAKPGELLVWLDEPCALTVAHRAPEKSLGIRIGAYTLVVFDQDVQLLKTLPLAGTSGEEVGSWLSKQGFKTAWKTDLPASLSHAALTNLDRTISNVHETIGRIAGLTHGSSPVHTDPQTLETIMVIRLASREGESARLIVLGFSPEGEQGEIFVRTEPGDAEPSDLRLAMCEVAAKSDVDAQATLVELFLHKSLEQAYASLSREWRSRRPSTL